MVLFLFMVMDIDNGWIKIHRKILEWEWYDDNNTFKLFIHLLLKANHKDNNYRGIKIKKGQIMTGISLLSKETNISIQSVRTSLSRLKSTNELTIKTSPQGSIIQLINYNKYQVVTNKLTDSQQTTNKQTTTNKNEKNEKNNIPQKEIFINHAISKIPNIDQQAVGLKYDAWVINDWHNGKDKKITNWKSSLNNTLPYLPIKEMSTKEQLIAAKLIRDENK